MPLNIDFLQILLHMLNFVILAGGLFILLYKPVNQFLEQRKNYFADLEKRNKESLEENKKIQMEFRKQMLKLQNVRKLQKRNGRKPLQGTLKKLRLRRQPLFLQRKKKRKNVRIIFWNLRRRRLENWYWRQRKNCLVIQ